MDVLKHKKSILVNHFLPIFRLNLKRYAYILELSQTKFECFEAMFKQGNLSFAMLTYQQF